MFAPTLLASLLALAPPDPAGVSLAWEAASGCPSRERALELLRELLPSLPDKIAQGGAQTQIEVTLDAQADGAVRVELRFVGERGVDVRSFVAPSCELAANAALLVVAVTIDPVATAEQMQAEPEPAPEFAPEREPAPEVEPAPEREPEREPDPRAFVDSLYLEPDEPDELEPSKVRFALGLLGGGGWGPIRAGTGSLALDLAILAPWWRVGLRGLWALPRTIDVAPDRSARFDAWLLAARGCVVPSLARGRLELPICLSVEAGALRGRGVGNTPNPSVASQPWVALGLGPGLRYLPHPSVALGIEVDALVGLVRGGFTIGDRVAQQHAIVGVRALLGLELRLPRAVRP